MDKEYVSGGILSDEKKWIVLAQAEWKKLHEKV